MEKQRIEEIAANRMQVIAPLLDPTIDHARYEELKADTAGKFQVSERTLRRCSRQMKTYASDVTSARRFQKP